MAKTLIAQNVTSINPITFTRDGDEIVGMVCRAEVNYSELGLTHDIDVWPLMNVTQKAQAQAIYNFLKVKAEQAIMG